jgi:hypothetical protein
LGVNKGPDTVWEAKQTTQAALRADHKKLVSEWVTDRVNKNKKKKGQIPQKDEEDITNTPMFFPTLPNTIEKESNLYIFQKKVQTPFEVNN